ncbi:MAG: ADP-ribosylglycohydrolase family protein [Myxococcota bacterium]
MRRAACCARGCVPRAARARSQQRGGGRPRRPAASTSRSSARSAAAASCGSTQHTTASWAARHATEPLDGIQRAIRAGGDTDTHAAIVGAWLGAAALPDELVRRLHDGPFGPSHLRALGLALRNGDAAPAWSALGALARNLPVGGDVARGARLSSAAGALRSLASAAGSVVARTEGRALLTLISPERLTACGAASASCGRTQHTTASRDDVARDAGLSSAVGGDERRGAHEGLC